jgi:hypothetical protein
MPVLRVCFFSPAVTVTLSVTEPAAPNATRQADDGVRIASALGRDDERVGGIDDVISGALRPFRGAGREALVEARRRAADARGRGREARAVRLREAALDEGLEPRPCVGLPAERHDELARHGRALERLQHAHDP